MTIARARMLGAVCDLLEKLCGVNAKEWFEALKRFLHKVRPWPMTQKTVWIGIFPTVDALHSALLNAGCRISETADGILRKVIVAIVPRIVNLVVVSVAELGFPDGATLKQIYEAALERGFVLCPAEVGPQLRIQYLDQPMGEWLFVAMEPIADSNDYPRIFLVFGEDGDLELQGTSFTPEYCWGGDRCFVFGRPIKQDCVSQEK